MQTSIAQVVADILEQIARLEENRRLLFLKWLRAHSAQVGEVEADQLAAGLRAWFASMDYAGLSWEYRLILGEMA